MTTPDQTGNNSYRPFMINSGATVTLSGLTIANGRTTAEGGGVATWAH